MAVIPNQAIAASRRGPILLLQLFYLTLAAMLVITVPVLILSLGMEKALLWGIGLCAMLILLLPILMRKEHDIFEPISFAMLYTIIGVTLRIIYLLFYYQTNNDSIAFLLRGKPPEFILSSGVLILVGLFFFVLGYMVKPAALHIDRFAIIRRDEWSTMRLFFSIFVIEVIAAIATYLFVKEMGIQFLALSDLSSKHFSVVEGASFGRSSLGLYRWPASWTAISFYLGMAWFATSGRRWFSLAGAVVILLGVGASIFPFLNSSRTDVVFIIINGLVVSHYLRKEFSVKKIGYAVMAIIVILLVMMALRKNVANEVNALADYITIEKVLDQLVGSGKFLDVTKPAHIMAAIPSRIDYQCGLTLVLWLLAPIPRSIWLSKPAIMVSTVIGQYVYETMDPSGGGATIPPGFVGELFWNFHVMGVVVGMFVMGLWLKLLYYNFKGQIQSNKNAMVIYLLMMSPCVFVLDNSFGQFILDMIKSIIPLLVVLRFIGKPTISQTQ